MSISYKIQASRKRILVAQLGSCIHNWPIQLLLVSFVMPSWVWAFPAKEGTIGSQADVCHMQFVPMYQCLDVFPEPGVKSTFTYLVYVLSILMSLARSRTKNIIY